MNKQSSIYSKKIHPDDILVLASFQAYEKSSKFFSSFKSICVSESFPFLEYKVDFPNLIQIFVNNMKGVRRRGRTKKEDMNKTTSKNFSNQEPNKTNSKNIGKRENEEEKLDISKNLESLLNKYASVQNVQKTEETQKKIEEAKEEEVIYSYDPEYHSLRLNLFYVDTEIFDSLYDESLENIFLQLKNYESMEEIKNLFIFENMENLFISKSFKSKLKQIQSSEKKLANSNIYNAEYFMEWLIELNIKYDFDYKLTETTNESLEYVKFLIYSIISNKNKGDDLYINKETKHTDKSKLAGFDNLFSLIWIDFLMAIPGLGEDKAIAIIKEYPTFQSLIKAYGDCQNTSERENMLKNIQIYKMEEEKSRYLGIKLSTRIYKVFSTLDEKKLVME